MSDHAREIENARAEAKRLSEEHAVQLAFHDAREESAQRPCSRATVVLVVLGLSVP